MKSDRFKRLVLLVFPFLFIAATGDSVKHVLIIGDSISIGYTPILQKSLSSVALIEHNPGNGGSTVRGKDNIEKWIGNKKWDIILFNFGLHDLVYKDDSNNYDVANGKVSVTLTEYRNNLKFIVSKLRETTAKLIFVNTTMVPENSVGRKIEDPARYNQVALEVMKGNNIEVIDLYTSSLIIHPQNSRPGNVHYSDKGYELLAEPLIKSITAALQK
ncbi:MAG: SGNH/GDSL hydrolase family protein [Bacteroidota bacterium]|nr:SGNH/GDSL hydrolase family protein [Bacteroidota bacterium]